MSLFQEIDYQNAVIATGQSLSAAVGLGEKALCGIFVPLGWTAADITFQASPDGGTTWGELYATDGVPTDATAVVQIHSPVAGTYIAIDPDQMLSVNMIKVRSGTSGSPVNQTGGATLILATRGGM